MTHILELLALGLMHLLAAGFQMFQNMLHLHGATIMLGVTAVQKMQGP